MKVLMFGWEFPPKIYGGDVYKRQAYMPSCT